jgi:uncharacterized protein
MAIPKESRSPSIYARQSEPWRTWTFASILVAFLSFFVGALVGMGAIEGLKAMGFYPDEEWGNVVVSTGLVFGASIAALLLWVRFFERKSLSAIGLGAGGGAQALRGAALGVAFVSMVTAILMLAGACSLDRAGSIASSSMAAMLPSILLIIMFVVQASFEEMAMRGWIMPIFAARYGLAAGIIVSTLLFTLGHVVNIAMSPELGLGIFNVFFAGLFLALYAITEKSLWGPCGWHAAWNWTLGQGFGLSVSGADTGAQPLFADMSANAIAPWWLTGGTFGPEASIVTSAVLLSGCAYWLWRRGKAAANPIYVSEVPA